MDRHRFFGTPVLLHGVWRVDWRLANGFPDAASEMPRWQERASKTVHLGLLAAILVMPVSGVLMTLSRGRDLALWDVLLLPSFGEIGGLQSTADASLEAAAPVLIALVGPHLGAVLKHHPLVGGATLPRMISGTSLSQ